MGHTILSLIYGGGFNIQNHFKINTLVEVFLTSMLHVCDFINFFL